MGCTHTFSFISHIILYIASRDHLESFCGGDKKPRVVRNKEIVRSEVSALL